MTKLVLVAHAPLATALKTVAAHVFPEAALAIEAVDIGPDDTPDEVEAGLRQRIGDADALLLCDALGATPYNAAQRLRAVGGEGRIRVVSGVNVPMLWRVLCFATEPLDRLAKRALDGGVKGIASDDDPAQPP